MIQVRQVTVTVGDFRLDQVSVEIPSGGYGVVIGPSGSGKSTLLEAIAGHRAVASGRIALDGQDRTEAPPEQRSVGVVHQLYHLFPHLSVRDNIGYGLTTLAPAARRERIGSLAERLTIASLLDRSVHGLSGGERQRVALARALAPAPRILLLDEPFAALDPSTRRQLHRELVRLHRDEGTTTLQVTHDFEDALRLADRVTVLQHGRVVQAGRPDEVLQHPSTPFVADFVNAGNVLAGTVVGPPTPPNGPFVATFVAGPLALEVVAERAGPGHALIGREDILLRPNPGPGPPRNQFMATVERIEMVGGTVSVHLDAGVPLVASILPTTLAELALAPGVQVAALVKATAIRIF